MKTKWTHMLRVYMGKLPVRLGVFVGVLWLWGWHRPLMRQWWDTDVVDALRQGTPNPLHVLWVGFMLMMLLHLVPRHRFSMALQKRGRWHFRPSAPSNGEATLHAYMRRQHLGALWVALVWLVPNAVLGVLHLAGVLEAVDLLMLSVFYFLCDYICILFFCPFQTFLMGNKCCVNCRIFDWGHIMMFTPMAFVGGVYGWTLFATAMLVWLRWEWAVFRHPERFWEGTNASLKCAECQDRTCQFKRRVTGKLLGRHGGQSPQRQTPKE